MMKTNEVSLVCALIFGVLAIPSLAWAQTFEQTIESLKQQVEVLTQKVNALSTLVQTAPVAGLQSDRDLALSSRRDSEWTSRKKLILTGDDAVLIKSGAASIELRKDGSIRIRGQDIDILGSTINVKGSQNVTIKGSKISSN